MFATSGDRYLRFAANRLTHDLVSSPFAEDGEPPTCRTDGGPL
jgi:hypothetical protein